MFEKNGTTGSTGAADVPDYPLAETVRASTSEQLKALADPLRTTLLHLLAERAATTTELAEAVGRPKGTIDHHLKVLQRAGLVDVVRTRRVRALTERFWGRTGRTIIVERSDFGDASATTTASSPRRWPRSRTASRAPPRCASPASRLSGPRSSPSDSTQLAIEFIDERRGGDTVFGMLLALAPTNQPALRDDRPATEEASHG